MRKMQSAFTLVELMAVVAIMALLAVASASGYSSIQRGMRERSAVAASAALLRSAKERAAIDRVPTAVFCYNVMLRDKNADADENAVIVGVMKAVRRAGRLTQVSGRLLYDEFGDLEKTYGHISNSKDLSSNGRTHQQADLETHNMINLYKFPTSQTMEYSLVADTVWCTDGNKVHFFSGTATGGETNCLMSAFYRRNGSKHEPNWAVGDAYAFGIGELQLPLNMTFGDNVPKSVSEISSPKVILFDPTQDNSESVEIYTVRAGVGGGMKFLKAGTASSDEDKKL